MVERKGWLGGLILSYLRGLRRRLAGAERDSCVSQLILDPRCGRVRATEHAPRGPSYLLERRHAFAEIVERGAGVLAERHRVVGQWGGAGGAFCEDHFWLAVGNL